MKITKEQIKNNTSMYLKRYFYTSYHGLRFESRKTNIYLFDREGDFIRTFPAVENKKEFINFLHKYLNN